MEQATESVSLDSAFDALGHRQRRHLLVSLLEHNPQDDSPVVWSAEEDSTAMDHLVMMHHVHIPKLEDGGYIEWDRESHEVSKGPNFEEIRPMLELLVDHEEELPNDWI